MMNLEPIKCWPQGMAWHCEIKWNISFSLHFVSISQLTSTKAPLCHHTSFMLDRRCQESIHLPCVSRALSSLSETPQTHLSIILLSVTHRPVLVLFCLFIFSVSSFIPLNHSFKSSISECRLPCCMTLLEQFLVFVRIFIRTFLKAVVWNLQLLSNRMHGSTFVFK